jgi:hypothetical protein
LKVGLAWAGRREHRLDRFRSIPFELFKRLLQIERAKFYSLQKDSPAPGLADCTSELHDFADTAALVQNLDLVIAVDTAAAHLAGAMGKPVWTLLNLAGEWRWLTDREDSPWYPTMRLFRQRAMGDWDEVIERVAAALIEFERTRIR